MSNVTPADRVVVVQAAETRRRRPWKLKAALGLAAVAAVTMVVGEVADRVPGLPNVGPRVERETKEGMSTVIAQELIKLREFRGSEKVYSVNAEMTKKETHCLVVCKTKQDQAFIATKGYAEGVIDFMGVNESSVHVTEDNRTVTIRLPHARRDDIRASHASEDVKIIHDTNRWCDLSVSCELVSDAELLQLADRKVVETANADQEIIDSTEREAEAFLGVIIKGVGRQLLRNQNPGVEPPPIDVRLEFFDQAPQTVPPQLQR